MRRNLTKVMAEFGGLEGGIVGRSFEEDVDCDGE
jgi:hypothetical protein